ncbi:MAG: PD-(D/E)XK nuclease family protein [Hadesarchaea archaeon]|nr:PD-(D/E)XK nuclease family protein [Hadesarchaea archaeon]
MDGSDFNFSDLIDDFLKTKNNSPKIGVYWPSEIGACIRQSYYKRFLPHEMPKEKLRMFKSADLVHGFIREVLSSSNKVKLLSWEKPFSIICDDFEISGRLDDVIIAEIAGREELIVIEVKSISGKSVAHISAPKIDHVYQVHPYLRATRYEGRSASIAVIWYIARDTYADRFFTVFYDQRVMDAAIARVKTLHGHLIKHTLPPAEAKNFPHESWRCWFCPFERECRADYNPEMK